MDKLTFKLAGSSLLLLLVSAAWGLFRLMLRPIPLLADVMRRLSRNEGGVDVPYGKKADEVGQASEIASGAVQQTTDANTKSQGLAEAAQKIGEVVDLITDIAEQTNLLALNATIEAARSPSPGYCRGGGGRGSGPVMQEKRVFRPVFKRTFGPTA